MNSAHRRPPGVVSRITFALGLTLGFLYAASETAGAAPAVAAQISCEEYTPSDLTIDDPSPDPGQTITISGFGGSNDQVTIYLERADGSGQPVVLGTAATGPDGRFTATVTIPADTPVGRYRIRVVSGGCPDVASTVDVNVGIGGDGTGETGTTVPAGSGGSTGSGSGGSGLAKTGVSVKPFVNVGFAIIGAGCLMLLRARRYQFPRH